MVTLMWHDHSQSTPAGHGGAIRLSGGRFTLLVLMPLILCCGCKSGGESARWLLNGFLDPTQSGQFLEPRRNEIRSSLSILEEPVGIQDTQDPQPVDLEPSYAEQIIMPGDVINVSIFELITPGQITSQQVVVSRSGYESLPSLGRVKMAGRTISQLEMDIAETLREQDILPNPEVQVALVNSRTSRFSIIGSIPRAGTYEIPQPEYRLLQAIADAGGVSPIIQKIYVFRSGGDAGVAEAMSTDGQLSSSFSSRGQMGSAGLTLSDVSGGASSAPASAPASGPATAPASGPAPGSASRMPISPIPGSRPSTDIKPAPPSGGIDELQILEGRPTSAPQQISWDPDEGWVIKQESVPSTQPQARVPLHTQPTQSHPTSAPIGSAQSQPWPTDEDAGPPVRIIEIPTKELLAGDPRYNIVIRPSDLINVPPGAVGEFYMMGNIARPGAYDLTGRRLTVKEAIASAGGFGPLAWPSRADLIRRVSQDEEQIIQLDLDAVFAGNAPDFYLKPNDIVNVGTTPAALFLAVLRNAFRFSYGFGFVYDRNFADSDTFAAREQVRQRRIQEAQLKGVPLQ